MILITIARNLCVIERIVVKIVLKTDFIITLRAPFGVRVIGNTFLVVLVLVVSNPTKILIR